MTIVRPDDIINLCGRRDETWIRTLCDTINVDAHLGDKNHNRVWQLTLVLLCRIHIETPFWDCPTVPNVSNLKRIKVVPDCPTVVLFQCPSPSRCKEHSSACWSVTRSTNWNQRETGHIKLHTGILVGPVTLQVPRYKRQDSFSLYSRLLRTPRTLVQYNSNLDQTKTLFFDLYSVFIINNNKKIRFKNVKNYFW